MSENKKITVTSPLLPDLEDFIPMLRDIWERKWLTNNGHYHQELENELAKYLGVNYISLFTNGTLPLITALQAMRITGEVITTPYSFVATTHSIWWNGLKPVFVDVDEKTGNIDPEKIEAAITPRTTAIMPVHVYGTPCNTKRIQEIADIYGLKVIYDAVFYYFLLLVSFFLRLSIFRSIFYIWISNILMSIWREQFVNICSYFWHIFACYYIGAHITCAHICRELWDNVVA